MTIEDSERQLSEIALRISNLEKAFPENQDFAVDSKLQVCLTYNLWYPLCIQILEVLRYVLTKEGIAGADEKSLAMVLKYAFSRGLVEDEKVWAAIENDCAKLDKGHEENVVADIATRVPGYLRAMSQLVVKMSEVAKAYKQDPEPSFGLNKLKLD